MFLISKFWGGPTLEILSKEAWLKKSPCNSYPIYVAISYIKCNSVYLWRDSTDSNSLSILSNPTTDRKKKTNTNRKSIKN